MKETNACGSCQNCCQGTIVRVRNEDIQRWRRQGRYDIILCLESWMGSDAFLIHKKDKEECIFLTTKGCEIYETRPQVCKEFPKTIAHAAKHHCTLIKKIPTKKVEKDEKNDTDTMRPTPALACGM